MIKVSRSAYFLVLLIEECAEVIQRACKAIRFGLEEKESGQGLKNYERLNYELKDLETVEALIYEQNVLNYDRSRTAEHLTILKREKIRKYMDYSIQCGTIGFEEAPEDDRDYRKDQD